MKLNIRIENWGGHEIRFIERTQDDWWAVAKDISKPLGYANSNKMTRYLDKDEVGLFNWKKKQKPDLVLCFSDFKYKSMVPVVSETGIYEAIFNSGRDEAKEFKKWVKEMIKKLRQSSGLEGFQIFRMLDKEHQKETMSKLSQNLEKPVRVDFIKANSIAHAQTS